MCEDQKKKSDKELGKLLAEQCGELRNFRFSTSGSRVRDIRSGRNIRKKIARILTELRQRDSAQSI